MSEVDESKHSEFVNVVSYISMALGAVSALSVFGQYVKLRSGLSDAEKEMLAVFDQVEIPQIFKLMLDNMDLILACSLLFSVALLITGVGLLKRKNWARLCCIGLLVWTILFSLVALVAMFFFLTDFPLFPPNFSFVITLVHVFNSIFTAAYCAVLCWLIYKLCTVKIRAEFTG